MAVEALPRPYVIAHRGASADAPENTLAAFELACVQGADMLELDVQQSADGTLVVFHDETTVRWDGQNRLVRACSLHDLRSLDIGGEQVPTLAEVCTLARIRQVALNVELKQPDIVRQTVAVVRESGMAGHVLVSSFYATALRELHQFAPEVPHGYLMGTQTYRPDVRLREGWPFLALRGVHATAWHPSDRLPLLRSILPLVRRAGYAVNVWTVDDPGRMRQLLAWGATGIITNRPDVARHCFAR